MWEMWAGRSQSIPHERGLVRPVVTALPWEARFKEVNMIQYNSFISLMKEITARWGEKSQRDDEALPPTACLELH